jgi:UDP-N-acetylmuramyl pentapeptide synthase
LDDRHSASNHPRDAKLRIFERARHRVVPRGLGLEGTVFSADDPLPAEPRMPGRHNHENAAAATAAMVAYAYDQIDQARAELNAVSK